MRPDSNIVAGSNVFLSRTDDPGWDPEFVAQIQDCVLLKELEKRKERDRQIADFSEKQREILRNELRCLYAKDDPCWGYVSSRKRVVSACINGKCPKIKECNPDYSAEEAGRWIMTEAERKLYGNPDGQPLYYIVDMIPDEEMMRYGSDPENEGFEYPVPRNPVPEDERDKLKPEPKTKTDPVTGRKMVVIGRRWMITDNAGYESEKLMPVWGYVEEVRERKRPEVRKKAKRIGKKQEAAPIKKAIKRTAGDGTDPDFARKEEFEKAVAENIIGEIKLTDVEEESMAGADTAVLLDNPAELAFVSSTFLLGGIDHGLTGSPEVVLALTDDYEKYAGYERILISSTSLKTGCRESGVKAWKALSERSGLIQLRVADREYYRFDYKNGSRWTCRNMYGVTHVCADREDIRDLEALADGLYPVFLAKDGKLFAIFETDGTMLGHLKEEFTDLINALEEAEEIAGTPEKIKGLSLKAVDGRIEILGMGNLKFIGY